MTLFARFRAAAASAPGATAVDVGREVSYAELEDLVARRAGALSALGLPPHSRVGLVATRGLDTYVSYLAVLSQGHAVVPLGADNPVPYHLRIAGLAGLAAAFVPSDTHAELASVLPTAVLAADASGVPADPVPAVPEDTAYVLFTSGSTGTPKGVPIRHGSVCSYLDHVVPEYEVGVGSRLSHTFALTFDPSVFDLFAAWTTGATLVVPRGRELLSPPAYVRSRRLSHWFSVPSLAAFARRAGRLVPDSMPELRHSKFIGEPLTLELARLWHSAAPASRVDNVYGPTELTIACTGYRLPRDPDEWPRTANGTVPIGRLYPRLEAEVVDGELCVRGAQRFAGYLDPSADAGRFLRAGTGRPLRPGEQVASDDWYRTGDRVRDIGGEWLHLGRSDRQVKVSGYRVELMDVEAAIRGHPAVDDAAVVAVPDGVSGNLVLFAVVCGDQDRCADLAAFLGERFPPYTIPSRFAWMPDLPVNASGKTDYPALRDLASVD